MPRSLTLNTRLSRAAVPDGVLVREVDGEAVMLNLNRDAYFGLDEVGTRMWNLLTTSESVEVAYESLLAEYEVESEQLESDLHALIRQLMDDGLLELHVGSPA